MEDDVFLSFREAKQAIGGRFVTISNGAPMTKPIFFSFGEGGVDFPALKAHLDRIQWKGFLTVELDSSQFHPPLDSAPKSAIYLKNVLELSF